MTADVHRLDICGINCVRQSEQRFDQIALVVSFAAIDFQLVNIGTEL